MNEPNEKRLWGAYDSTVLFTDKDGINHHIDEDPKLMDEILRLCEKRWPGEEKANDQAI